MILYILKKDKKLFIKRAQEILENVKDESKKKKKQGYIDYITKHWDSILNMKDCPCGSSMESHISHCVAELFASRPKAYSEKNIENYLQIRALQQNDVNIYKFYLETYDKTDEYYENKHELDFSIFEKADTTPYACIHFQNTVSDTF